MFSLLCCSVFYRESSLLLSLSRLEKLFSASAATTTVLECTLWMSRFEAFLSASWDGFTAEPGRYRSKEKTNERGVCNAYTWVKADIRQQLVRLFKL